MKRLILIILPLLSLLLLGSIVYAQDSLWTKTYGGPGDQKSYSVQQTTDRGFIIAGYTSSWGAGGDDAWIIKTKANGDTVWTKTFGGPVNDHAHATKQTPDGGYIIAGATESFGAIDYDFYLIKTDSLGILKWEKTYRAPENQSAIDVIQTNDGGFVFAGSGGFFLLKTDSLGDSLWAKQCIGYGQAEEIHRTTDGGFILVGHGDSTLIKTDSLGNVIWGSRCPEGSDARSVKETADKGFILTGKLGNSIFLQKVDSLGDSLWTSYPGQGDGWTVLIGPNGGYYISGFNTTDGYILLKTEENGQADWQEGYGGTVGYACTMTSEGDFVMTGYTLDNGSDIYIVKIQGELPSNAQDHSSSGSLLEFELSQNYPNPFNPATTIRFTLQKGANVSLEIYDIIGRKVKSLVSDYLNAGEHSVVWNGTNNTGQSVASGIYFYRLQTNGFIITKKAILVK